LERAFADGPPMAALVCVDLYGQCADYDAIEALCAAHHVPIIEDAAEALGATWGGRPAGAFGRLAVFSFNGNKIITTSGGGMVVTDEPDLASRIRHLATQARQPVAHYEHTEVGYNYRLSNLLAALGRGQLSTLDRRVDVRRAINQHYRSALGLHAGVGFMPEHPRSRSTSWLTCITLDPAHIAASPEQVRLALERHDIEARPVWKPMHLQPVFAHADRVTTGFSDTTFARGLCLPSGTQMTRTEQDSVIDIISETITGTITNTIS
jgi:dTDP-4-amino-4,6-dideoxygalactose transaminase